MTPQHIQNTARMRFSEKDLVLLIDCLGVRVDQLDDAVYERGIRADLDALDHAHTVYGRAMATLRRLQSRSVPA